MLHAAASLMLAGRPRSGIRFLVSLPTLERTRVESHSAAFPVFDCIRSPSYSRGALSTLHNAVLPPRGRRIHLVGRRHEPRTQVDGGTVRGEKRERERESERGMLRPEPGGLLARLPPLCDPPPPPPPHTHTHIHPHEPTAARSWFGLWSGSLWLPAACACLATARLISANIGRSRLIAPRSLPSLRDCSAPPASSSSCAVL